ncbi:unnamed protein product [Durusdinium trenchii]|uniref:Uncharacterized protein n=1 Tax=Durusdinium trenchii TaxID=1381693 RepID=A0ABP0ILB8_9DINO
MDRRDRDRDRYRDSFRSDRRDSRDRRRDSRERRRDSRERRERDRSPRRSPRREERSWKEERRDRRDDDRDKDREKDRDKDDRDAEKPEEARSAGGGSVAGAKIHEEVIGGRTKYRARLPCGSLVIQGPLRALRETSEQDLVKMEAAWVSDGLQGVQKLQPELFRIREPRVPNRR